MSICNFRQAVRRYHSHLMYTVFPSSKIWLIARKPSSLLSCSDADARSYTPIVPSFFFRNFLHRLYSHKDGNHMLRGRREIQETVAAELQTHTT